MIGLALRPGTDVEPDMLEVSRTRSSTRYAAHSFRLAFEQPRPVRVVRQQRDLRIEAVWRADASAAIACRRRNGQPELIGVSPCSVGATQQEVADPAGDDRRGQDAELGQQPASRPSPKARSAMNSDMVKPMPPSQAAP